MGWKDFVHQAWPNRAKPMPQLTFGTTNATSSLKLQKKKRLYCKTTIKERLTIDMSRRGGHPSSTPGTPPGTIQPNFQQSMGFAGQVGQKKSFGGVPKGSPPPPEVGERWGFPGLRVLRSPGVPGRYWACPKEEVGLEACPGILA